MGNMDRRRHAAGDIVQAVVAVGDVAEEPRRNEWIERQALREFHLGRQPGLGEGSFGFKGRIGRNKRRYAVETRVGKVETDLMIVLVVDGEIEEGLAGRDFQIADLKPAPRVVRIVKDPQVQLFVGFRASSGARWRITVGSKQPAGIFNPESRARRMGFRIVRL